MKARAGKGGTTGRRRVGISLVVGLLAVSASLVALTVGASAQKGQDDGVNAALTTATITSAGPLSNVYLGSQLNCQVDHTGDSSHEFFGGIPTGACATLIAIGGVLYGPAGIDAGGSASPRTTYTEVSQSAVTGSGTSGDPFRVVTVVAAGATGIQLTQTDSYVVGTESYRTDVVVSNTGNASQSFVIYRAGDCFLQGSDVGFGDLLPDGSVGCRASDDGGLTPGLRIERWIPITGGSSAYEAGYNAVWAAIGTQNPFPNTCLCTQYIDNGAGLSWQGEVAVGASATFSHLTVFSPLGVTGPFLTKTAAVDTVPAGGTDSYTITINNPTGSDVSLTSITDTLPDGFTYTPGSTTGVTTSEPTVAGQDVTWTGTFTVPAGGTATLTFGVTVSSVEGTYTNSVVGEATAQAVEPIFDTAPITVTPVIVIAPRFVG